MRLDAALVARGLCASRTLAQKAIEQGRVSTRPPGGERKVLTKASVDIADHSELFLERSDEERFVSRGGQKLLGALQTSGLSLKDHWVLDLGQSTGGFTDCALQMGATGVVGVDVGKDQLHPSLRGTPKVHCIQGFHIRDEGLETLRDSLMYKNAQLDASLREGFSRAVADVSFISLTKLLPSITAMMREDGEGLFLVKPQFEVGADNIGKNGIVKDESLYPTVRQNVTDACLQVGLKVKQWFDSPITGGDGNKEFFIWVHKAPISSEHG